MVARVRAVVWAESARDALDEVIAYIAHDSQQAAVQVLDAALEAGASLAPFAERGRIVPELNDQRPERERQTTRLISVLAKSSPLKSSGSPDVRASA
jgi:plasmid stabilization system protein ParE